MQFVASSMAAWLLGVAQIRLYPAVREGLILIVVVPTVATDCDVLVPTASSTNTLTVSPRVPYAVMGCMRFLVERGDVGSRLMP